MSESPIFVDDLYLLDNDVVNPEHLSKFRVFQNERPGDLAWIEKTLVREIERGRRNRFSSGCAVQLFRWYAPTDDNFDPDQDDYKINSNLSSYITRWFIKKHPRFAAFFKLKPLHGKKARKEL